MTDSSDWDFVPADLADSLPAPTSPDWRSSYPPTDTAHEVLLRELRRIASGS
jgi:hypothetical protein